MSPVIRKATADDLESICRIEQEGQGRWSRIQFADELKLNFSRVYVIEDGGAVIGFAVAWIVADEIQLNNIGIKKEFRRRGLGTLIMNKIIMHPDDAGPRKKIYLEVSAQNKPAILFYRNNGFIEMGRRKNYYDSIDAILMERELRT